MKIRWFRRSKKVEAEPIPEIPEPKQEGTKRREEDSYERLEGETLEHVREWNRKNAFPVNGADLVPVDTEGEPLQGAAMDQALSGLTNIKSAFSIDTNRAPDTLTNWYIRQGFIGYQTCSFIAQHWLVNRACSIPGKDAVRNGYKITTMGSKKLKPEVVEAIDEQDQYFKVKKQMAEFDRNMRIFGIRIVYFKIKSKDKNFYKKPFNIDGVTEGSYEGMVQVDPYWITPELDGDAAANPASPNFYEPTYWRINGKLYHRSHLIIERYAIPTTVLKPTYIYGGIPLTQLLYERVYAAERTANEAPALAQSKRLFVMKANTKKALANLGGFISRLNIFARFKNNHGLHVVNEDEEVDKHDTSLTDFPELMDGQYDLTASISGVPVTKLMMRAITGGLSNAGDGDNRNYNDMVEDVQTNVSPLLTRHHLILMKSHIEPKLGPQPKIKHIWNPLRSLSDKEKAAMRRDQAETDKIYLEAQVIDQSEVRDRLAADEESGYSLNTVEQESEDIDFDDFNKEHEAEEEYANRAYSQNSDC